MDLVAEATDAGTGVSANVAVSPGTGAAAVRITLSGLRPGTDYLLYVVTKEGRSVPVAQWRSASAKEVIEGTVPIAVDVLAFFAIGTPDGAVVVSVPFGAGGASVTAVPR